MIMKSTTVSTDIASIIEGMTWHEDPNHGHVGVLPPEQLDRKAYLALKKALEAVGGKWNRGAGGFVFKDNPSEAIAGIVQDQSYTVIKDGFFVTPEPVVRTMLELLGNHEGPYLEPSAGEGDLLRAALPEMGVEAAEVDVVELNDKRRKTLENKGFNVVGADILDQREGMYKTVLMNPPFERRQDAEHVLHVYHNLLAPGGKIVAVVSAGVIHGDDRKSRELRALVDKTYGTFVRLADGSFKESGTAVHTYLVKLEKPLTNRKGGA